MANERTTLEGLSEAQARIMNSSQPEELKKGTRESLVRWAKNSGKYGVVLVDDSMVAGDACRREVRGIRSIPTPQRGLHPLKY